jgi:hypothetical protein
MADQALPIDVPPAEAIAWFRAKGYQFGFSWQDVEHEEHGRGFTVAKAMTRDLLETLREAVDRAIAEGETLQMFAKELRPRLEAAGWWGRKEMVDPATGESELVQLGSPRRLKTIFETNMRTSYAAGRWERIERNKRAFPRICIGDGRTRAAAASRLARHGAARRRSLVGHPLSAERLGVPLPAQADLARPGRAARAEGDGAAGLPDAPVDQQAHRRNPHDRARHRSRLGLSCRQGAQFGYRTRSLHRRRRYRGDERRLRG